MVEPLSKSQAGRAQRRRSIGPLLAMMALFFLVVCAVGILRPIKNALALDGLGATDFYKVYLVSACVVLFVPLYNRLAYRFEWRWLIPGVALFFAANLLIFRLIYVEGSTAFGLFFYGWYDLFAAALVTQFFMATQLFLNARTAKHAYPLVIAGGSIGATLGGGVTGFFAERVGTPNLLLVAAVLIALFSAGMPLVWRANEAVTPRRRSGPVGRPSSSELRDLARNPQLRLIAAMVLITVLVKQLVDYQFNTLTKEVFQERDAISAFQGRFNAATQWLPLVALGVLQPALRRYGMAVAVLLLPAAMVLTNAGLALFFGLWAAVGAKGAETALRYSAERAGREILYVPVPEDVKLRAKAWIDVAIEKGIGKVSSALLIFLLLSVMDYRSTVWVGLLLSLCWLALAFQAKREYVRTLARSIAGRFASLRGVFASITDATTIPVVRRALSGTDPLETAFALELVGQAPGDDIRPLASDLRALASHDAAPIRARALRLLERVPSIGDVNVVRAHLRDPDESVREAAVLAFIASGRMSGRDTLVELLSHPDAPVRTATLACLARGDISSDGIEVARSAWAARPQAVSTEDREARIELALAAGTFRDGNAVAMLEPFLADTDPRVVSTALRSAGLLRDPVLYPRLIDGLAHAATREAAREALSRQGEAVLQALEEVLLDREANAAVRRSIPSVLAQMPGEKTVSLLLRSALAPETDQLLDYRTIKALSKLRVHDQTLTFHHDLVQPLLLREVSAARRYAESRAALAGAEGERVALLRRALAEAWRERRETGFRTLGLELPPDATYRCFLALTDPHSPAAANAFEWLETSLGSSMFRRIDALLVEPDFAERPRATAETDAVLRRLAQDDDPWIAHVAARALDERTMLQSTTTDARMDLIEKVFLLQKVDVLRDARSAHQAMVASIAEEIDAPEGAMLMREGEPADALYVVVRGTIELRGMGGTLHATNGSAFGTWALIDEAPSVVEARVTESARLLRVTRDDFQDLVGDHPELAIGMLQGLARRVRALVA